MKCKIITKFPYISVIRWHTYLCSGFDTGLPDMFYCDEVTKIQLNCLATLIPKPKWRHHQSSPSSVHPSARRIPGQSGKLFPWCEISVVRHGVFGPRMSWESYFPKESKWWHSKYVYSIERLQWHPLKSEFLTNRGRYHKMVLGHHRGISWLPPAKMWRLSFH